MHDELFNALVNYPLLQDLLDTYWEALAEEPNIQWEVWSSGKMWSAHSWITYTTCPRTMLARHLHGSSASSLKPPDGSPPASLLGRLLFLFVQPKEI